MYILEEGAANVADPPGLDKPEGILWRLDTLADGTTKPPGTLVYGMFRTEAQAVPAEGDALGPWRAPPTSSSARDFDRCASPTATSSSDSPSRPST